MEMRSCSRMRINLLKTLRRAECRDTRMGINQVAIDFEPYNLFPSSPPLSCYGNIEDATAAFLAQYEGWSTFDFVRRFRRGDILENTTVSDSRFFAAFSTRTLRSSARIRALRSARTSARYRAIIRGNGMNEFNDDA